MIYKISFILILLSYNLIAQKQIDPIFAKVDKKTSLGKYKPQDLVDFNGIKVSRKIVPDLKKLLAAAKKDGLTLKVVSGYRSYEKQKQVFESWIQKELRKNKKLSYKEAEKLANKYSAMPGHSEHQLGTTVDILSSENNFSFSLDGDLKYPDWLSRNSLKFNFKISYPTGHPEYTYEPWHLRWIK